jgi:hypothetical protein
MYKVTCGRSSMVECYLPKVDVVGPNPIGRFHRSCHASSSSGLSQSLDREDSLMKAVSNFSRAILALRKRTKSSASVKKGSGTSSIPPSSNSFILMIQHLVLQARQSSDALAPIPLRCALHSPCSRAQNRQTREIAPRLWSQASPEPHHRGRVFRPSLTHLRTSRKGYRSRTPKCGSFFTLSLTNAGAKMPQRNFVTFNTEP